MYSTFCLCIASFHLTSWRPCRCNLNKRIFYFLCLGYQHGRYVYCLLCLLGACESQEYHMLKCVSQACTKSVFESLKSSATVAERPHNCGITILLFMIRQSATVAPIHLHNNNVLSRTERQNSVEIITLLFDVCVILSLLIEFPERYLNILIQKDRAFGTVQLTFEEGGEGRDI